MLFYRSEEQNGEKMANTACTGRWGFCAVYKHFLASSFSCSQAESTPSPAPVTQTDAFPGAVLFVEAGAQHKFVDIEEDLELLVFFAPAEQS